MKEIRKALEKIAEHNSLGNISDDLLIKACETYKIKDDEFTDSYDYHVKVSKSIFDHINKVQPDEVISKAVLPGQTKVIDGVMYIYTATPNAKTPYDWRVYKKSKIGRQVDDDKVEGKQKYVNELFPSDLSSLKVVKQLGGSTGAKLVEDDKGNQFVMKKGSNTSNEHVKSEYLANQLYDILGQRVPDYELYEDNGEVTLLSKFVPLTRMPNHSDYDQMAKGFVVDALLANWDVYMNDNCLIDSAGRVLRVDNGGSLDFSAQGRKKTFGYNCDDFKSMQKYNPAVVANLSAQDYIDQITEVLKKKQDVIDYLKESSQNSLSFCFEKRFESLEKIRDELKLKVQADNIVIQPRNLLPPDQMYREFTEDELKDFWNNQSGHSYRSKLHNTNSKDGWELLKSICKERNFDARPLVIEDDNKFWDESEKSKFQLYRGIDSNSLTAAQYADMFRYDDNCFFGNYGIHGSGIYFHINDGSGNKDSNRSNYKNSDAHKHAVNYAGGRSGVVLDCYLSPDAKVGDVDDLREEIRNSLQYDKKKADEIQAEIDDLNKEISSEKKKLNDLTGTIERETKQDMHWDDDTLISHQLEIDGVDWLDEDEDGNRTSPNFDTFVKGKVFDWVTKNGGKIKEKQKDSDVYVLTLPNSKESFMITRFQYEDKRNIKQKNSNTAAYNLILRRFSNWLIKEHYEIITKQVEKNIADSGTKSKEIRSNISELVSKANDKCEELNKVKVPTDPDKTMMAGICHAVTNGDSASIGVYAAIKGYDAIVKKKGNNSPYDNSFCVVLNRSKVVVRKKNS